MSLVARRSPIAVEYSSFDTLDDTSSSALFDELTEVVASSFTPSASTESSWAAADWVTRKEEVCERAQVFVARCDGDAVGFLAFETGELEGIPLVIVIAACVRPEWQSRGIGFALNLRLLVRQWFGIRFKDVFVAARILNPKAVYGWRSRVHNLEDFWPRMGTASQPNPELEQMVKQFVSSYEASYVFDPVGSVIKERHGPASRTKSLSHDPDIDGHFERYVNLDAGDTVLVMVHLSRRLLRRELGQIIMALPRALYVRSGRHR